MNKLPSNRIDLGAPCIIVGDKLLVMYKTIHPHYETPGGKVEVGETPAQAAVREAKEEIDCDVEISEPAGYFDFSIVGKDWRCYFFLASIAQGQEPKIMEPNSFDHLLWMPIADWKNHKLSPPTKYFCEQFLSPLENNK